MTQETGQLSQEIKAFKQEGYQPKENLDGIGGYNVAMTILTDLFGCILIGGSLGFFFQFVFDTSVLLTAGLTLLGGIAGLYTTIRYALSLERSTKP